LRCELLNARSRVRVTMAVAGDRHAAVRLGRIHAAAEPRPVAPSMRPAAADGRARRAIRAASAGSAGSLAAIAANASRPAASTAIWPIRPCAASNATRRPARANRTQAYGARPSRDARRLRRRARRSGASAGLGTSRALAYGAVGALLAAGFVAARRLKR
jgi:hypothetical protein